jgi:hypothetical protein
LPMLAMMSTTCLVLCVGATFIFAQSPTYVGYERCKDCHPKQYQSWSRHAHSRAFAPLQVDHRRDGKCVVCHATGTERGQLLEHVQCEACHGPGSLYKGPTVMSKGLFNKDRERQRKVAAEAGLRPIDERTCLRCHGKERPGGHPPARPFEYAEALHEVRH